MLADEARAAVRAAEAASKAAQKAHAAAKFVLEGLEASTAERGWEPRDATDREAKRQAGSVSALSGEDRAAILPAQTGERWTAARQSRVSGEAGDLESEVAQPVCANLIQFPREIVAMRKVRPRRAEGPLATAESEAQLSIFEVDSATVSTQPAATAMERPLAPVWMGTQLPCMEQDTQWVDEVEHGPHPVSEPADRFAPAPQSRRLLAITVDASLMAAAFLAVGVLAAASVKQLPSLRMLEISGALAAAAVGAAYQALSLAVAKATPGMKYAGIELGTLDGRIPGRAKRCARLAALPLSVLPLGLGLIWALFDDGCLTWHDRLSGTYLRKR